MSLLICRTAATWSLVGVYSNASSNSRCQLVSGENAKPSRHLALRVELQQLIRHVAHFGFDARLGLLPGGAAQTVERRRALTRAAILLDQIHARERHVELRFARILQQHEVARLLALRDRPDPKKLADAVRGVDHEIARFQIRDVGLKRRSCDFEWPRAAAIKSEVSNRSSEPKIARCESVKHDAAPHTAFDQKRAGHGAGHVGAFGKIRGVVSLVSMPSWNGTLYSCRMSASRSSSPVDGAKNTTRPPCSTIARPSDTAICMLPWNVSEGRVEMCNEARLACPA